MNFKLCFLATALLFCSELFAQGLPVITPDNEVMVVDYIYENYDQSIAVTKQQIQTFVNELQGNYKKMIKEPKPSEVAAAGDSCAFDWPDITGSSGYLVGRLDLQTGQTVYAYQETSYVLFTGTPPGSLCLYGFVNLKNQARSGIFPILRTTGIIIVDDEIIFRKSPCDSYGPVVNADNKVFVNHPAMSNEKYRIISTPCSNPATVTQDTMIMEVQNLGGYFGMALYDVGALPEYVFNWNNSVIGSFHVDDVKSNGATLVFSPAGTPPFTEFSVERSNTLECVNIRVEKCQIFRSSEPSRPLESAQIRPNPVSGDQLNVFLPSNRPVEYSLAGIHGQVVLSGRTVPDDTGFFVLDLRQIPAGLYVLNLGNGEINEAFKLVKTD